MTVLSHRIYGQGETKVYILHGIFGMKDNWHNAANELGKDYCVVTIDARNHGKSFHTHEMSYAHMANDVVGLMDYLGHASAIVMGHSMGGKTAMMLSMMYPERVDKLIVVDIALKAYTPSHLPYFQAFEQIDFTVMQSRTEAETAFMPFAPEPSVRQFLLKNLESMPGGGYQPRFNLPAIKSFYAESIGNLNLGANIFNKPTLFIKGENSQYLTISDEPVILQYFPFAQFHSVSKAGHWVHADNPTDFLTEVRQFIPA